MCYNQTSPRGGLTSSASCGGQYPRSHVQKDESMNEIKYKPIGIIHSPFKEPKGTPIQPAGAKGINGIVEIFPEYAEGLKDIGGFSHIILLYHFHLSKGSALIAKPYMDNETHGVLAMRGPSRPQLYWHLGSAPCQS